MKKIITSLLAILSVNMAFADWAITGSTTVCANQLGVCGSGSLYTYTVTGFPSGATETSATFGITGGSICSSAISASTEVRWHNNCNVTTPELYISSVTYKPSGGNSVTVAYNYNTTPYKTSINVARLNDISVSSPWNTTPAFCNTSSINYGIQAVCGATNYVWTLPSGWNTSNGITSGANLTSISAIPNGSGSGVLSVTVYNTSNGCNITKVYSLNITRPVQAPVFTTTQTGYCGVSSGQFCVGAVANASSYSWTYPSGWTGPATTTSPCATVSFNGQVKTGNICCQANISCSGASATSAQVCLSASYETSMPTDAGITFSASAAATSNPAKKSVTVSISTCYWSITKSTLGTNGQYQTVYQNSLPTTGPPGAITYTLLMINGDIVTLGGFNQNACGRSEGTGKSWKLVNGQLQINDIERINTTSINEKEEQHFKIFPNPASSIITVASDKMNVTECYLSIYDVLGKQIIESSKMANATIDINVSDLENGIYFLQMEQGGAVIRKEKIIITH